MTLIPLLTHDDIVSLDKRGMRDAAIYALMVMEAHRRYVTQGLFWSKQRK